MKENKEVINQQQIDEWKAQHGKIYKTIVGEYIIIWRKLKRKEYVQIMSKQATEEVEGDKIYARQDMMLLAVALYPDNLGQLIADNAGLASILSDEIILKSGFDLTETQEL